MERNEAEKRRMGRIKNEIINCNFFCRVICAKNSIFLGQVVLAKKFYLFKNRKFTPSRKRRYLANYCDLEALTPAPKTGVKKKYGGGPFGLLHIKWKSQKGLP